MKALSLKKAHKFMKLEIRRTAKIESHNVKLHYYWGEWSLLNNNKLNPATSIEMAKLFQSLTPQEIVDCFGAMPATEGAATRPCLLAILCKKDKKIIKEAHKNFIKWMEKGLARCLKINDERSLETWLWPEKEISISAKEVIK